VANINNDGKSDLVVASDSISEFSVLLGNGDGTFQAAIDTGTGFTPNSIAVGDFNGDGIADVAVAGGSNMLSIFFGKGNGTFQAPVNYTVDASPQAVAVGDFNGDGKPDLAIGTSHGIDILLNKGNGTFQAGSTLATGDSVFSFAVGDFNGDHKLDLAASTRMNSSPFQAVSVFLGNGDGTLQAPVNYALEMYAGELEAGALTGDGKLDLVVASEANFSASVSVLLANGDGTFQPAQDVVNSFLPIAFTLADFNSDGKLDLAVTNPRTESVDIYTGHGDGTFQAPVRYAAGNFPNSVTAGDFNGDGAPDLAVGVSNGSPGTTSSVNVLLNQNSHIFATGAGFSGGPQVNVYSSLTDKLEFSFMAYDPHFLGGVRVALGDINGDGVPDIITAPGPTGGPDIRVFDGATGKMIDEIEAFDPHFLGGEYVAAGVFNGQEDIVVGADAGGGPEVRVFNPAGLAISSFYAYDPAFGGGVRVTVGDVNGDGHDDIITGAGSGGGPHVKVFDGTTIGGNAPTVLASFYAYNSSFTGGVFVAAGDTDNDGQAEIITGPGAGSAPRVKVFAGDGSLLQSFLACVSGFQGGVHVGAITDVDGNADILTGAGSSTGLGAHVGPRVHVFDGVTHAVLDIFYAYNPKFLGGVYVGGL
jgi:hypothetical protein